jgi:hypothetical protein
MAYTCDVTRSTRACEAVHVCRFVMHHRRVTVVVLGTLSALRDHMYILIHMNWHTFAFMIIRVCKHTLLKHSHVEPPHTNVHDSLQCQQLYYVIFKTLLYANCKAHLALEYL